MDLIRQARKGIDPRELSLSIISQFGGIDGFSKEFVKVYNSKLPASAKVKMIEAVLRLSQTGKADQFKSLAAKATDAELKDQAKAILNKPIAPPPSPPSEENADDGSSSDS